jgi:hypothetical protein
MIQRLFENRQEGQLFPGEPPPKLGQVADKSNDLYLVLLRPGWPNPFDGLPDHRWRRLTRTAL